MKMSQGRVFLVWALLSVGSTVFSVASAADDISGKIEEANKQVFAARQQVSQLRNAAAKLAKDTPGKDGAAAATGRYAEGISALQAADIGNLSVNVYTLESKLGDLRLESAILDAREGNAGPALDTLESFSSRAMISGLDTMLKSNFDSLKGEPRYQQFLKQQAMPASMGNKSVIGSAYQEKLSVAERVAGLSLFWAEARRSFVHFSHVPDLDWDKVYMDFLPQVLAAQTTREYYDVMLRLAPLLQDGHTNIYPPEKLSDIYYSRPALRTSLIGGTVLITDVYNRSLAGRVHAGDEITSIDGMPVHDYAQQRVAPLASSSTPQDKEVRMYSYQLLLGEKNTDIRLGLRDAQGKDRVETVQRGQVRDILYPPQFEFRMLPGDIAYMVLGNFEDKNGPREFEKVFPQILQAKGLILDVRANGGGSSNLGYDILSFLSKKGIPVSLSLERQESNTQRAKGTDLMLLRPQLNAFSTPYVVAHPKVYDGPVAVLAGPKTFSAAEDFLVSFDTMKRGIIVGTPTGGSTGQPLTLKLPGGGTARICVKHDYYPDGREFVGKGIAPDISAAQTVEDQRAGRDAVLEQAVAAIQAGKAVH
ncbi:S41 family peptidase [Undibacterium sp. TJN25]|uniref:S41 family peptidase n=1 Tax=Undibacterium sp. TJN25 TaxID=3413056 RepID=UPI003BF04231